MTSQSKQSSLWIIRTQYFLYFGVFGFYLPYFNLYCYHLGFSGTQIGSLSAFRSLVLVISPLLLGALADRFRIRRPIYIFCNMAATFTWLFYFTTVEFWPMMAITVVHAMFFAPIISFLEAFTMDVLSHEKKSYGRIRAWGSVAFITSVVVLGRLIDMFQISMILTLIFCGSLIQAVAALRIPQIAPPQKEPSSPAADPLTQRPLLIFLLCGFLMLVSHGAYYGFFSIHLENLGYSNTFIGLAWALASIAEILVMINSARIFKRYAIEKVLIFSFLVAMLRWVILFFVQSPILILFSQCLHAVTYGTFHMASILYIDHLTSDKSKTLGQAVNNAVQYGLGLMIGFLLNGYLYEHTGSSALFIFSGLIALSGGVIFAMFGRNKSSDSSAGSQGGDTGEA